MKATTQKIKISEGIEILAAAIRSRARQYKYSKEQLTDLMINSLGDEQASSQPETIAARFYMECSEHAWKRVLKNVRQHYFI